MTEEDRDSGAMIEILIRARYSLIYAVSFEEGRVGQRLRVIADARKKQLLNWTITSGLELPDGSWITELKDPIDLKPTILLTDYYKYAETLRDKFNSLSEKYLELLGIESTEIEMQIKNIVFSLCNTNPNYWENIKNRQKIEDHHRELEVTGRGRIQAAADLLRWILQPEFSETMYDYLYCYEMIKNTDYLKNIYILNSRP